MRRRARSATVTPASVLLYASRIVAAAAATASRKAGSWSAGTEQTAIASRGIALRLLPPASETSRNGTVWCASRSARPSTLTAFDRPSAIPVPEWPPLPPLTVTPSVDLVAFRLLARRLDADPRVGAPGAPDRQPPVLLAVEVDEDRARHERRIERVRAFEPDLLRHRHQQLEGAVGQRLVLDERHHRRDRDAVVGAERGAVRGQPLTVPHECDPPLGRVVGARRIALADHVEVPLQRHEGGALTAGRGRHPDDQVPARILLKLEAVLLGPRAHVLDHGLLVPRRPWRSSSAPRSAPRTSAARGRSARMSQRPCPCPRRRARWS